MIRILCWNIQTFGANKLGTSRWDHTMARRQHILSTVAETNALAGGLDVFIVMEVRTTAGFGELIGGGAGPAGVWELLGELRGASPAAGWSLVPPLVISPWLGYCEGVAVFFKSTTLNFVGPMMWDGTRGVLPEVEGRRAYVESWAEALPATPSVRPHGDGPAFNQNQLAGKAGFHNEAGAAINFPHPGDRSPWMTQFYHAGSGRYLSIFAVHFPTHVREAIQAFGNLATVPEIIGSPVFGGEEDRVVIGDFNINSLIPGESRSFRHLNGNFPGEPNSPREYRTAFGLLNRRPTLILPTDEATTHPPPQFYGYGSRTDTGMHMGLDNIFVHRSGNPAPPLALSFVVNRVIGTPTGYTRDMATDIPTINDLHPGAQRTQSFRSPANYGHIGGKKGTSDHLAICVRLP